jgi:signal transduction histidine kinase
LRDNASVRGDGELLAQAVVELLDNAAEASRDGETVTIDADCGETSVAISVSDCGPGIPAYQIDLVQEPFTRLSGKLEPLRGHIGIGLAIVRRIVELHGGRLVFAGIEPHGCRATIELPAAAPCRG